MEMTLVLLALLAFGTWKAWGQISTGSGMICSHFSQGFLESLNAPQGRVKKWVLAIVLGYFILAGMLIRWIVILAVKLTDGTLFRN